MNDAALKTFLTNIISRIKSAENSGERITALFKTPEFEKSISGLVENDSFPDEEIRNLFSELINGINTIVTKCSTLKSDIVEVEKNNAIALLSGGVAHEFNNILSGISGYLESMSSGENTVFSKKIFDLIERAGLIVEKLMNLSKHAELREIKKFSPETEISGIIDLMNYKIKEFDIRIETEFLNKSNIIFNISDFYSIVSNLIINSVDALKNSSGRKIIVKTYNYQEWFYLSVWDSGRGMDSAVQKNIFNPFFTTKPYGSGLGLSVIRKIILESGGDIAVCSEPDKFTEFKIKLPVSKNIIAESNQTGLKLANIINHNLNLNRTVLFIDSNEYENHIIKDLLIKNNITVSANIDLIDECDAIIIDSRHTGKIKEKEKFSKLSGKRIALLLNENAGENWISTFNQKIYFLIQPLGIDELNRLIEFIVQSKTGGIPFYEKKNSI
ncbi:MAG TPA: HAMP domain-containing sensor histidine kinase [bacterium]|nr:HAMP domain-containing sensor histidine kinase [bacterium]HPN31461.1 HAMP domain-containing sensor histidine kinase [bacterium]